MYSKNKTQKAGKSPLKGWKNEKPGTHQKTEMLKKCGRKCFLERGKGYPICKKNTCKVSKKGVYAAFVRGRQYKNARVTQRAKRLLGIKVSEP
jgi:hypothetical protein